MRKALYFAAFLLAALPVAAQTTAVTGTITDPNGVPYSFASVNVSLTPASAGPALCGINRMGSVPTFTTNVSGFFSINLCPNASVTPSGSQWLFSVAIFPGIEPPAGLGPQSFSLAITIAGASQDVSVSLSGVAPVLSLGAGGVGLTHANTFNNGGNATQPYVGTTGPVTPLSIEVQGGKSSFNINSPDVYLHRLDSTVGTGGASPAGCTAQQLFSPCDELPVRIEFSNKQTTGVIPNMVGLSIAGNGFASNTPIAGFVGNFEIGLGIYTNDAAVPNVVHLRGENTVQLIQGLPAQFANGTNSTRSVFGKEIDQQNSSGTDAVFNGTIGNYTGGISLISAGNSNTVGLFISTNNTPSGKGYLNGIEMNAAVNCGICIHTNNSAGIAVPASAIHLATPGANGLVVGAGTITEPRSSGDTAGNPTIGILLDAKGTAGVNETQNSNSLVLCAKTAATTCTNWHLFQTGADNVVHLQTPLNTERFVIDANANLAIAGNLSFSRNFSGSNAFTFLGTPTGARTIAAQDASGTLPLIIASGTSTMASGAIGNAACAAAVTTAATNALTTDTISWAYATAPSLTTDALLTIAPYVTANNVNFTRCNPTASSITGTAIVINWRVIR